MRSKRLGSTFPQCDTIHLTRGKRRIVPEMIRSRIDRPLSKKNSNNGARYTFASGEELAYCSTGDKWCSWPRICGQQAMVGCTNTRAPTLSNSASTDLNRGSPRYIPEVFESRMNPSAFSFSSAYAISSHAAFMLLLSSGKLAKKPKRSGYCRLTSAANSFVCLVSVLLK